MNEENRGLLTNYIADESKLNHTIQGLKGLKCRIPKLFDYLEEKGLEANEIRIKEAIEYQNHLVSSCKKDGGQYSKRTINAYIVAVTNFYNYLKRSGIIYANPFKEIRKIRGEFKIPSNLLKEKGINIFLAELGKYWEDKNLRDKITAYKVHVIAELMYSTGLRIFEVANLKVENIDFARGIIKLRGKQNIERFVILNEYSREILRLFIGNMRELIFNERNKDNESLFGAGWEAFQKTVNRRLKKVSTKLKYQNFTSHNFRHCLGFHLLRAGCDIRYIQAILGHKLLRNTEIYTKVEKEDLKNVLDKFHPRQLRTKKDEEINA